MAVHTFGQLKQPLHYSILQKAVLNFGVPASGFVLVIAISETMTAGLFGFFPFLRNSQNVFFATMY